jgi:hypothetical protein
MGLRMTDELSHVVGQRVTGLGGAEQQRQAGRQPRSGPR